MIIKSMKQFLVDEFCKFKIEVIALIQYVRKLKTLTMNVQTYLSINILVFLGIEANIFMLSLPFDRIYNQEYYNMLFYVGHTLYILFVFITNYMRLNYYKKASLNWLNVIIMISLVMVLLLGKSITISSSNFSFRGTTDYILGNEVLWSVDTPEMFFPFLMGLILFGAFGIDKLWSAHNTILIDSLWFYGRSTVRQWHMFNVFLAFIMYNFVVTYTIEPSILRYTLYIYLTYTVITMICRRLMDTNSSIFWLICLFVPLVNIYVLYLLYNKTSALYDQESNSIFYYPL